MYTVTISSEQAEAIEHLISRYEKEDIIRYHVNSKWDQKETVSLNALSLDEIIIATYCEYKEEE